MRSSGSRTGDRMTLAKQGASRREGLELSFADESREKCMTGARPGNRRMEARQDRRSDVVKNSGMHAAIRELGTLFNEGAGGMFSDRHLLDRFVERREASAFEAILDRYGPLVWGVCRRVLRDHHDAEDAFQATFLVLARKAAAIMPREKLGNWLYGVAFQTAMKARATRAKRRVRERPA